MMGMLYETSQIHLNVERNMFLIHIFSYLSTRTKLSIFYV